MGQFSCGGDTKVCRERGIEHCNFVVGGTDQDEIVEKVQQHMRRQHDEELTRQQILDALK